MIKRIIYLPLFNGEVRKKRIKFPSITIISKVKSFNLNSTLMWASSIKSKNQASKKLCVKSKVDGQGKFASMILFYLM